MPEQCKMNVMTRVTRSILLVFIITAGVALRSYQLMARSIWFDEAFTWRLLQFPWAEVLTRASQDVHPPFYYLLIKLWATAFGTSLISLRAFSVTCASLLILLVYGFTLTLTKRRPSGLLSASLVALNAWQIALSTEARMYTLTAVLTIGMLWALYRQRWVAFITLAIFLAYTHYYGLLILAAAGVWFLWSQFPRSPHPWRGILAFSAVAIAYLPWLPIFLRQLQKVQHVFWIPPFTRWSIPETLYHMLLGTTVEPHHQTFTQATLTLLPAIVVAVLILALLRYRPTRPTISLISTIIVCTFFFSILASLVGQSIYQDRYFLPIHSLLLIVVAMAVQALRVPRRRQAAVILILSFFFVSAIRQHRRLDLPQHPGMRAAISHLATQLLPPEPLLIDSAFILLPALYYQQQEFPALPPPQLIPPTTPLTHFAGTPVLLPADILPAEFFTTRPTTSFWLITTTGFSAQPISIPSGWQQQSEQQFSEVYPYQGDVILKHYKAVR